jgi:hypothetical protein
MSYGTDAYTGDNPIGGGEGYVSPYGFSQSTAHETVTTLAELEKVMGELPANSEKLTWIPDGVTIVIPTIYSSGGRRLLKNNLRGYLASNLGTDSLGGGKIRVTAKTNGYMTAIWQDSYSKVSGLTVEGPGAFEGTTPVFGWAGNCAFRSSGTKRIEYENCHVFNFAEGLIKFTGGDITPWNNPTDRHWIHHCNLHGSQRHGFGYGVSQAEGYGHYCAALIEATKLYDCRHLVMCDHGQYWSYELRYNDFGDSWYKSGGTGAKTYACQIDAHGSGDSTAGYAGYHYEIYYNDFSINDGKANIGVRGIPRDKFNIYKNRTRKTNHSGAYPADGSYEKANVGGSLVDMEGGEGGYQPYGNDMPAHNVFAWDNWYGASEPPDDLKEMLVNVAFTRRP